MEWYCSPKFMKTLRNRVDDPLYVTTTMREEIVQNAVKSYGVIQDIIRLEKDLVSVLLTPSTVN